MCSQWLEQVQAQGPRKEYHLPQQCHRHTIRKIPQATMINIPNLEKLSTDPGSHTNPHDKDVSWLHCERKDRRVPKELQGNWKWTGFKGVPGCQMLGVISVYKSPNELATGLSIGHLRLEKRKSGTYPMNCPNRKLELSNIDRPNRDKKYVLETTRGLKRKVGKTERPLKVSMDDGISAWRVTEAAEDECVHKD